MKKWLTLCLLLPFHVGIAQWHLGGRTGVTFSKYKSKTNLTETSNAGFAIGLTAYNMINRRAGVIFGFDYIQKGYQHQLCSSIADRLDATYLEVPMMFDYSIPISQYFRFHTRLGFYGAYWITAQYKTEGYEGGAGNFDFKKNKAKRIDYGPNVGVMIDYTLNNSKLGVEVKYAVGIRDMQDVSGDNTKNTNRVWLIGLSYMLPVKK